MQHKIVHASIGLEDVHPLAFWELLGGMNAEYRAKLDSDFVSLSGKLVLV